MKKNSIAFLLLFFLSGLCLARSQEQGQVSSKIPAAKIEKIGAAAAAWMGQHKAPVLSVAIVLDNQTNFSKGSGLADVENNVAAARVAMSFDRR